MVEDVDELTILVLNTAGRQEAIAVYEEETGCSHAESWRAVENLACRVGNGRSAGIARRVGMVAAAIVGIGVLAFLTELF